MHIQTCWQCGAKNQIDEEALQSRTHACVQCGAALAPILIKQASVAFWELILADNGNPSRGPCAFSGVPDRCFIQEIGAPIGPGFEQSTFSTLALSATGGSLRLAGDLTATFPVPISVVASILVRVGGSQFTFSSRDLATPIAVAAGQHVYVTVTFSFS